MATKKTPKKRISIIVGRNTLGRFVKASGAAKPKAKAKAKPKKQPSLW